VWTLTTLVFLTCQDLHRAAVCTEGYHSVLGVDWRCLFARAWITLASPSRSLSCRRPANCGLNSGGSQVARIKGPSKRIPWSETVMRMSCAAALQLTKLRSHPRLRPATAPRLAGLDSRRKLAALRLEPG